MNFTQFHYFCHSATWEGVQNPKILSSFPLNTQLTLFTLLAVDVLSKQQMGLCVFTAMANISIIPSADSADGAGAERERQTKLHSFVIQQKFTEVDEAMMIVQELEYRGMSRFWEAVLTCVFTLMFSLAVLWIMMGWSDMNPEGVTTAVMSFPISSLSQNRGSSGQASGSTEGKQRDRLFGKPTPKTPKSRKHDHTS
jgi:hypothetical protein